METPCAMHAAFFEYPQKGYHLEGMPFYGHAGPQRVERLFEMTKFFLNLQHMGYPNQVVPDSTAVERETEARSRLI